MHHFFALATTTKAAPLMSDESKLRCKCLKSNHHSRKPSAVNLILRTVLTQWLVPGFVNCWERMKQTGLVVTSYWLCQSYPISGFVKFSDEDEADRAGFNPIAQCAITSHDSK